MRTIRVSERTANRIIIARRVILIILLGALFYSIYKLLKLT